jgi:hypothetical protein
MKRTFLLLLAGLAALSIGRAQTMSTSGSSTYGSTVSGTREFTLGASGASDRRFSGSTGGASGSYGMYLNDNSELVFRQSFNFSTGSQPLINPPTTSGGATTGPVPTVTTSNRRQWDASSRIAFDQHFGAAGSRFRPFLGVNFGGVYGRSVTDTWAAGLEAGGKYYVQPRTFVQGIVEYGWFFRHANSADRLRDGQWNYSLGMGFTF